MAGSPTMCASSCIGSMPRSSPTPTSDRLHGMNAVLVPGGFGERGVEGKIAAVTYARDQVAAVPRHLLRHAAGLCRGGAAVAGSNGASSTEFGACADPVVGLMTEWEQQGTLQRRGLGDNLGGTMRLGAYPCVLEPGSLVSSVYGGAEAISERIGIATRSTSTTGRSGAGGAALLRHVAGRRLPEMVELPGHPWFVGVQFHPELKSRPMAPHPLFAAFIRAAVEQSRLI